MHVFPQLLTGASCQFPISLRIKKRTIANRLAGGTTLRVPDGNWSRIEWTLEMAGLKSVEWEAIESLFDAVNGRFGKFLFLDPSANLLVWSEQLDAPAWTRDPFLQIISGMPDPFGTFRSTRLVNSGPVPQRLEQTIPVPGWFQYCLSIFARADGPTLVRLFGRSGEDGGSTASIVGHAWQRLAFPIQLASSELFVHFGFEVEPGDGIEVFGMQLEAQPGASMYKKTTSRSGVYAEAHFLDDVLTVKAQGPDEYGCVTRVGAQS